MMRNMKEVYNVVTVTHLPMQENKDDFFHHDSHFHRSSINLCGVLESDWDYIPQISCLWQNSAPTDFRATLLRQAGPLKLRSVTFFNGKLLLCIPKNSFKDCRRQTVDHLEKNKYDCSVECTHLSAQKGHLDELLECISNETVVQWLTRACSILEELPAATLKTVLFILQILGCTRYLIIRK